MIQISVFSGKILSINRIEIVFILKSRNRGLCLPLLKYNVDVRYWIPKIMCGGIEKYVHRNDGIDLWLISR